MSSEQGREPHVATRPSVRGIVRNVRDLPSSLRASTVGAGLFAVLVVYTGPIFVVVDAARRGGLTAAQSSSWIMAIIVGSGVCNLTLSLTYRQPLLAAFSTSGTVLLVVGLQQHAFADAVGAYVVASLLVVLVGVSGTFERLLRLVPEPVVMGMLGGVLLHFAVGLFDAMDERPVLVVVMVIVTYLLRRRGLRAPALGALLAGLVVAAAQGLLHRPHLHLGITRPVWTTPHLSVGALLGIALPLAVLTLASQDAPGVAVLRTHGYQPPVNGAITVTGIVSLLMAPFGGAGVNLAAITAAIVTSPEAHPDPDRRYAASVVAGVGKILVGLLGATALSLFAGFPKPLVAATAGLALLPTVQASLARAMHDPVERDGGMVAFLCAASSLTVWHIGAPFWALVLGMAVHALLHRGRS